MNAAMSFVVFKTSSLWSISLANQASGTILAALVP